jgi:hypothetical protein
VKPALVLKSGHFAWGPLGEGNASVEDAQPIVVGPHWAATGSAPATVGTTFVSRAALDSGLRERLGSRRRFVAVSGTRQVRRTSLLANTAVASIQIDPGDGTVRLDGRVLASSPTDEVPMSSRYGRLRCGRRGLGKPWGQAASPCSRVALSGDSELANRSRGSLNRWSAEASHICPSLGPFLPGVTR